MPSNTALNASVVNQYHEWIAIQRYAARTQELYKRVVRRYVDFLAGKFVAEVTHLDIRSYLARIGSEGVSANVAYVHLCVLRRFYDFLHLGWLVDYVAPRFVKARSHLPDHPRCMSEFVVRQYLRAARTPREKALIEFLYGTGCRTCEVSSLRIENVDFDARVARVSGKGRAGRPVLITKRALRVLQDYVGSRKSGYVFQEEPRQQKSLITHTNGTWIARWKEYCGPGTTYISRFKYLGSMRRVTLKEATTKLERLLRGVNLIKPKLDAPISGKTLAAIVQKIGRRSSLPYATPYMFRHSFATHLLDHGADLFVVQWLLGHAHATTTETYAKVSHKRIIKALDNCHPEGAAR